MKFWGFAGFTTGVPKILSVAPAAFGTIDASIPFGSNGLSDAKSTLDEFSIVYTISDIGLPSHTL